VSASAGCSKKDSEGGLFPTDLSGLLCFFGGQAGIVVVAGEPWFSSSYALIVLPRMLRASGLIRALLHFPLSHPFPVSLSSHQTCGRILQSAARALRVPIAHPDDRDSPPPTPSVSHGYIGVRILLLLVEIHMIFLKEPQQTSIPLPSRYFFPPRGLATRWPGS